MPRYYVDLPAEFIFSTIIPVAYGDLNPANHFAADRVLPLALETQLRFMRHLGYTDPTNLNGIGLFMINSQADYISQARHGDRLKVDLAVINLKTKTLDFVYRIMNADTRREVARVQTGNVAFHYAQARSVAIPDDLKAKFGA